MITDPDEFTLFNTFNNSGVITTDTFNDWRKKTNGIVQFINDIEANSVSSPIAFDIDSATLSLNDNSVTTIKIADLNVTTGKLVDSAVTGQKIANTTITGSKLVDLTITEPKLAADSVSTSKILNLNVTEAKLAADSVSTSKILNLNVTTGKLADLSVTTPKLANDAVTNIKIANDAITNSKITNATITGSKLVNGTVTGSKIDALTITGSNIAAATITADKLAANAIGTSTIVNGSVTAQKLSGAQTGSAPVFGARAWVKYNSAPNGNRSAAYKSGTYVRSGSGLMTVTIASHNLKTNDQIYLNITSGSASDGLYTVTSATSGSFVVAAGGSASSGNVTAEFIQIQGAGNISTASRVNGSDERVLLNFVTPMDHPNYAIVGTSQFYPSAWGSELYELTSGETQLNTIYQAFIYTGNNSRFANVVIFG